jgi:hypothetical protein
MGHGGSGKDGITVVIGSAGLAQANGQIFNQPWDMHSALFVAKRNNHQITALLAQASLRRYP